MYGQPSVVATMNLADSWSPGCVRVSLSTKIRSSVSTANCLLAESISHVGNTMAAFVMQALGCEVAALNTVQYSIVSLEPNEPARG